MSDIQSDRQVTSTDFQQAVGAYMEQSAKGPVFITKHGRPVRVLIDIDEFARLSELGAPKTKVVALTQKQVVSKLKRHKAEFSKMGILHLALFGSVARGDNRPDSDVDLLVEFRPKIRVGMKVVQIKERIEEILGTSIDLVRAPVEKQRLRKNIEQEAVHVF